MVDTGGPEGNFSAYWLKNAGAQPFLYMLVMILEFVCNTSAYQCCGDKLLVKLHVYNNFRLVTTIYSECMQECQSFKEEAAFLFSIDTCTCTYVWMCGLHLQ